MENYTFIQWMIYFITNYWRNFLEGVLVTVFLSLIGTLIGFVIGLVLSMIRTQEKGFKVSKKIIDIYIVIFRSTPMIVQAIIFYYGLSQVTGINIAPIPAAIIIVSINTGAYISEIIRSGINAIDKGQFEASKALGFTHNQAMIYIILPQTIKNILPAIGNEFIINIKDTAVLFAIGVTELYTMSRTIAGSFSRYYEVFLITSFIYFTLTFGLTKVLKYFEKKLHGTDTYTLVEED